MDVTENKSWFLITITSLASVFIVASFFYLMNKESRYQLKSNDKTLSFEYAYLISPNDSHTLESILVSKEFVDASQKKVATALGNQTYWHRYTVRNHTSQSKELTLFLDNYLITELDIHVFRDGINVGNRYLGNSRWPHDLEHRALPSYNFVAPPNNHTTFFIRSQSDGSANLPFALFFSQDFNNYKQYLFLLWGTLIGLVCVMAFYNVILYIAVRDIVYVYYVGYIITVLLEMGLLHGFIIYLLPNPIVDFFTTYLTVVHYLIIFFGLLFALKYLRFENDDNSDNKIGKFIAYSMLPIALSTSTLPEFVAVQIYFVIQGFIYIFILYLLVRKFKENFSWAKYYFISWMPVYFGGAITPLFLTGYIEYDFWTRNALLIAVMVEASLISMGLASRLRSNEKQILYHVTHDQIFDVANNAMLVQAVRERKNSGNNCYSIVVAEIRNYHTFSPYLTTRQLRDLLYTVAQSVQQGLKVEKLVCIDDSNEALSFSFIAKEGVLGFCVNHINASSIGASLAKINDLFPIHFSSDKMDLSIHCYFGFALSTDGTHPTQVTNKALQVLNTARNDVNAYARYTSWIANEEQRKILLVAELLKAIESNSLELYHQPQISLSENVVCGSETLLRWQHPTLGFIPPDEFVQIAEDTGIIAQLTHWVVRRSFEQHLKIHQQGFVQTSSVNLSVYDIIDDRLCSFVIEQAKKNGVSPNSIILEVTETSNINDTYRFKKNLAKLADEGFKIAIDDYGTGYSSLSYLSEHPIYELKIDKSLITDLAQCTKNELIVNATLSMAKSLKIKVVAEGTEDREVIEMLSKLDCDIAQGYYFSKPMPIDDYLNWLKEQELSAQQKRSRRILHI